MESWVEREIEFQCKILFEGRGVHQLFYGKPENTLAILKSIYDVAKESDKFLCSWHDASKINEPMDFFEPILRVKYGERYEPLKEKSWFKDLISRNEKSGIFQLAKLCGKDETSKDSQEQKLPLIFIDGIEELFFKIDYGHLDKERIRNLLAGDFFKRPLPKGFGDCLRAYLHQTGKALFYGNVKNSEGIEYAATLGNYHYLFYAENFMKHFFNNL